MDHTQEPYVSVCSGIGGLDVGLKIAMSHSRAVAYVEREAYAVRTLVEAIEDDRMDAAPIWTDVKTFPIELYRGKVRGIVGGYPCQPFSTAGNQKGQGDPRHLWPYIRTIVKELRPAWCFFENVDAPSSKRISSSMG